MKTIIEGIGIWNRKLTKEELDIINEKPEYLPKIESFYQI